MPRSITQHNGPQHNTRQHNAMLQHVIALHAVALPALYCLAVITTDAIAYTTDMETPFPVL
eukprot:3803705-Lingulodinium_polyedra.AAC.1